MAALLFHVHAPAREILVLIAYAQPSALNDHVDVSSEAVGLNIDLNLNRHHCIVFASSN